MKLWKSPLGRMQRHVLGEFLKALALSAGVLTGFFVLMLLLSLEGDAKKYGTDLLSLAGVLPYLLPYLLCFSLPMAFLVAAVLTFGRLEGSGEIASMRAAGMRLTTVAGPVLVLALVTAAPIVVMVDSGLEWGFARARERVLESGRVSLLSRAGIGTTLRVDTKERSFRIHRFGEGADGNKPLAIVEFTGGAPREVVLARDHTLEAETTAETDVLRFQIPEPTGERPFGWARISKPGEVLLARSGQVTITVESAAKQRDEFLGKDWAHGLSRNVRDAKKVREGLAGFEGHRHEVDVRRLRALDMEINRKLSFAFGPLALALVGIPLGLWLARGGKLTGFIVGIAAIALFYYPLWFAGQGLATAGVLPAGIAVWMAHIAAGGAGAAWLSRMV